MKVNKHNLIWSILFCTTVVFGQKQVKNINESFEVNKNVLVEINASHSDVTVETWNKNKVSIQGNWEIEGLTKEQADKFFKNWKFEALGNKDKVVITSKSSKNHYYSHSVVFDDMDFDFDFDSISYVGGVFDGDFYSELPPMPPLPVMSPMPPVSPLPLLPAPVVGHLKELEFDYEAYQKDKDGYMKKFEKRQQAWEKEFEEKFEPQMKAYEKQMEDWEKKMEPQMKAYEEKMKEWEKEYAPKMKAYEKRMEVRAKKMEIKLQKMEKEMEVKYAKKMKEKGAYIPKNKTKKKLIIKVPTGAILKIDSRYGKITLPEGIKTVN